MQRRRPPKREREARCSGAASPTREELESAGLIARVRPASQLPKPFRPKRKP